MRGVERYRARSPCTASRSWRWASPWVRAPSWRRSGSRRSTPGMTSAAVNTREEAIQRFGPPQEIRSSDVGPVLVYRRAVVVDVNPNRYYGEDRGDRLNQYELVLLYVDGEGRIVRRAVEPE